MDLPLDKRLSLGVQTLHRRTEPATGPWLPTIDEMADLVGLVDRCGYDSMWVGDHVSFTIAIFDPLLQIAQAAVISRRLIFGTGVYLLPLRHPTPVAKQVSTLDLSSDHLDWIRRAGGEIKEITVRTATLDSLLSEAGFPEIQFVTIDVEGHELEVLEGFTLETYRPRIVIIEDNSINGDPGVARYMAERGYVHFRRTGVNEWYAHKSDSELIRPEEIRSFERAKTRERWVRRRKHIINRIATRGGRHFPVRVKRRIHSVFGRDIRP